MLIHFDGTRGGVRCIFGAAYLYKCIYIYIYIYIYLSILLAES